MGYKALRGSVDGRHLYCRIPIRRKRTPLFPDEFRDMLQTQRDRGLTDDDIKRMADDLWQTDDFEHAGLLLSYLDFKEVFQTELRNKADDLDVRRKEDSC